MLSTGNNSLYKINFVSFKHMYSQQHLFLNEILQTVHETCSKQYCLQVELTKSIRLQFLCNKNLDIL